MTIEENKNLTTAAKRGDIEAVKFLLYQGVHPDSNDCGTSPLTEAIMGNHIEIVKLLLDTGADVNFENDGDVSPLMAAVVESHTIYDHNEPAPPKRKLCINIVQMLLEAGADVNVIGGNSLTPLEWLTELNVSKYPAVAKLLKKYQEQAVDVEKIDYLKRKVERATDQWSRCYQGDTKWDDFINCTYFPVYKGKEYSVLKDLELKVTENLEAILLIINKINLLESKMYKKFQKIKQNKELETIKLTL